MSSVFLVMVVGAIIAVIGLVVDGGQRVTATSRAETAAAGAARAAGNAAATARLGDADPVGPAVRAARTFLAGEPEVVGTVSVADGVVTVRTRSTVRTVFLEAIGIDRLEGTGSATAEIVPTGR